MQHRGTQRLETKRLILRRYEPRDAEDMYRNWAADEENLRFFGFAPHKSAAESERQLALQMEGYGRQDYYLWCIENKVDAAAIGFIYLNAIDEAKQSAAVHYLIGKAYWQRGFASEALACVLDFCFDAVGFRKIHSHHRADNAASGCVMQKCGMRFTKREYLEKSAPQISGEYCFYEISHQ